MRINLSLFQLQRQLQLANRKHRRLLSTPHRYRDGGIALFHGSRQRGSLSETQGRECRVGNVCVALSLSLEYLLTSLQHQVQAKRHEEHRKRTSVVRSGHRHDMAQLRNGLRAEARVWKIPWAVKFAWTVCGDESKPVRKPFDNFQVQYTNNPRRVGFVGYNEHFLSDSYDNISCEDIYGAWLEVILCF